MQQMGRQMDFNEMTGATRTVSGAGAPMTSRGIAKSEALDFVALMAKLKEEACKTPEQRAREGVLKKHDLSEEDYRRLPPDKRAGIDAEIAQAVRRVAEQRRATMAARNGAAV